MINDSDGNRYFLSNSLEIIQTKFIVLNEKNGRTFIYGSAFKSLRNFFEIPIESRGLHIYITEKDLLPSKLYSLECIKAKMFASHYVGDYDDDDSDSDDERIEKIVFVPLIHTLKK